MGTPAKASEWSSMGDAAIAANLFGTHFDAVGGYLVSPNAFHPWSNADWETVPGPKLPIFVASFGQKNGTNDGKSIVSQLKAHSVPVGSIVAVDMEEMVDVSYIMNLWETVHDANGYRVFVYGSRDFVFGNPSCNGYWVADYTDEEHMVNHVRVRATQWISGPKFDTSAVKPWVLQYFWQ